jgi:hypothetical protein
LEKYQIGVILDKANAGHGSVKKEKMSKLHRASLSQRENHPANLWSREVPGFSGLELMEP